jgi:hypothetical protein
MKNIPDTVSEQTIVRNSAASGGDCTVQINAIADNYHVIDWIKWSYGGSPSSGELKIVDNTVSNTILDNTLITTGGPGQFAHPPSGFKCASGSQISIVLIDGGQSKTLVIAYR